MKKYLLATLPVCLGLTIALAGCATSKAQKTNALRDAFKDDFLIGVAVNQRQFTEDDARGAALIKTHFNSITPENVLKWESVHPHPNEFNFQPGDHYVEFGEKNGMTIIGHTLVWHSQTPRWVFQDAEGKDLDRDALLARMRDHIHTVVGRYKGRIKGWDVVNEALNEDGTLRLSPWMKIIGEDYIAKAFEYAHEADPAAELYYNDYSLENPAKRNGCIALVKKLQAQGVKLTAIGTQQHLNLEWPAIKLVDDTLTELGQLGVKVHITELDVDVLPRPSRDTSAEVSRSVAANPALNPYTNGLPDSVQERLAHRYVELFAAYRRHPGVVGRVTFWGVTDADSWLNDWPIRGRTSYPLLFGHSGIPKLAFDRVINMPKLNAGNKAFQKSANSKTSSQMTTP